jgi:ketosteroid isomerase-like protein
MPANSPEDICRLFQQHMAAGDLDAVLSVFDLEAVLVNWSGEVTQDRDGLKRELAPLVARQTRLAFTIKQVIQSGDIVLMHTEWQVSFPQRMSVYAIAVARRQPDGTWCWLIGDPFTVGRHAAF